MPICRSKSPVTSLGHKQVKEKTAQERGKEFELDLQELLRKAIAKHPLAFVRLYDTRSAGSYLPEQPGDFLVTYRGNGYLVECKSSVKFASMAGSRSAMTELCSNGQIASMRVWARAGAIPLLLFRHMDNPVIEVWDGKAVAETFHTPRAKLSAEACVRIEFTEQALLNQLVKMSIGETSC